MSLILSSDQLEKIAAFIQPCFFNFVNKFDLSKYPESEYKKLLVKFSVPRETDAAAISDALRWKFGHLKKENYPSAHKALIKRVCERWPNISDHKFNFPHSLFEALNKDFPFITACFLTHLVHPSHIAIIDQHNFRSLGYLVGLVSQERRHNAAPSTYKDLIDITCFLTSLKNTKILSETTMSATLRDVDMFLMTYGKSLKTKGKQACRSVS